MKYIIVVSHGKMAQGIVNSVFMLSGKKEEVLSVGLLEEESIEVFSNKFKELIKTIPVNSEIILLGDIIGGSPTTTAVNILSENNFNFITIGGMNLPLLLSIVLMKDNMDLSSIADTTIGDARNSLKEFKIEKDENEDI